MNKQTVLAILKILVPILLGAAAALGYNATQDVQEVVCPPASDAAPMPSAPTAT